MRTCCIIFIFLSVLHTYATYQNNTVNLSCSGHLFEGGVYKTTGSIQPIGGSILTGGNYVNYSGSSSGFILKPLSSKNGIADEWSFDNDLDKISDSHEFELGSNLNSVDSDNDGANDYNEYIAGTALNDSNSSLQLSIQHVEKNSHRLSWYGIANRIYQLETASSIGGLWQNIPIDIYGNNRELNLVLNNSQNNIFYRLRVRMD